jgi:hypothetical protein
LDGFNCVAVINLVPLWILLLRSNRQSDNNKSSAISIVVPSDTPPHQWIRMKLAKSLLIFAKVLMNLRLSCAQIVRATSSAANHPARLLKIATG